MTGQYMHALMHTIEDGLAGDKDVNLAMNFIVMGMLIASTTPDTAQKLLDDAEGLCPGMIRDMGAIHEAIVKGVEHPEEFDCLLPDRVQPSAGSSLLARLFSGNVDSG